MTADYLITVVLVIPCNALLHLCLARLGGVEKKLLYVCVMGSLYELLNVVLQGLLGLSLLNALLQFALFPVSLLVFSKSRLPRCLLASGLLILLIFLSDETCSLLFIAMGGRIMADGLPSMFENPGQFLFVRVVLFVMIAFFGYLLDRLWAHFAEKADDRSLWYFMLFPLSQGLLIFWCGALTIRAAGQFREFLLTSLLALLCVAADYVMFRVLGRVRRQAADEQRADFMAEQLRAQGARDALLVHDAEQASKLHHDMQNQIQTIYSLLDRGEDRLAREQLDGLSALLPDRTRLCENRIADTVLEEKRKLCEQAGIAAEFSCSIPAGLPVDGVTLCSLFSNLLDNAMAACSRAGNPWLRLSADIQRGYFMVRCENVLPPQTERKTRQPLSEHGWGLDIVRGIAEKFGGRVESGPADGCYRTVVWLLLPVSSASPAVSPAQ